VHITEIRIKLTEDPRNKLKAYCSVTFHDEFVVRDLKIIEGAKGPFVAMPSRKLADRCPRCGTKNHLRAAFCNGCGVKLDPDRAPRDERGRARLHADLAHPINSHCRMELHGEIVNAFHREVERSKQEGYVPVSFEDLDQLEDTVDADYIEEISRREAGARTGRRVERRPAEGLAEGE
jgi:stage V sporulation protein G